MKSNQQLLRNNLGNVVRLAKVETAGVLENLRSQDDVHSEMGSSRADGRMMSVGS
jgi:hypothetical protein